MKRIVGIFICMLLMVIALPLVESLPVQKAKFWVNNSSGSDLHCEGEIVYKMVKSGSTVTGSFTVENIGKPDSLLEWMITSWPEFGTIWTFNPTGGTNLKPADGKITVTVSFASPTVEQNMYFGGIITICSVNNPSDFEVIAVNINVANKSLYSILEKEKVLTNTNDPLTIRAEVKEIGYRKVILSAYGTNTLDKQIVVKWSSKPCCFGVLYLVPNEEDLGVLVYNPYHKNIYNFIPTKIKFEPGEEKLIQTSIFFGISNWILPGLSRGYQKYIPSFPWLPGGDYRFDAYINPYFINNEWPQYHDHLYDRIFFHFGS